jgi:hypothetical protein
MRALVFGTGHRELLGANVAEFCNQMFQEAIVPQGFLKVF